jgi:phage anti-repressor protein
MQHLINIEQKAIGTTHVQTVDARELHAFLEVRRDFTNWIKQRITKYGFIENQDFICIDGLSLSPNLANQSSIENVCSPDLASKGRGGHNRMEYHLTIDMAKELSMVERTPKGKEARQYFIECERRLFSNAPTVLDETNTAIKQYLLFLRANKASGLPLTVAVEQSRQAMRDNGINIDKILPMPAIESQACTANDDAARDRIFSIIQSKGSVPQGTLFNRCRSMNKADFQKNIDVLLLQNKVQQVVLEHKATKKPFNCYRMAVTFN